MLNYLFSHFIYSLGANIICYGFGLLNLKQLLVSSHIHIFYWLYIFYT